MISIENISKSYSKKRVLDEISFSIERGETTSLIGPSGCGKSTLIRLVIGLIAPDEGRVLINGEEMKESSAPELRLNMGYVIQKGGLFPHLTARENCTLAADYLDWDQEKINERLRELCELTGISIAELSKYPSEFSGGQNQRIGLIRALMLDPEILLLDEPLGSIDPLVRYELQSDLKQIFENLGKTVLLVTHDLSEAGFLGDEIVLMNEGQIEQTGKLTDIIKNPKNEFVQRFVNAQRSYLDEVKK